MREEPFTVQYISVKNCYLHFSDHWTRRLDDVNAYTSVLRLNYNSEKRAYFSWSPQPFHVKDNSVVGISATYAQKLGIHDGDKVIISFHNHVASVSKVYVSPLTQDDYEIVEMNQEILQTSLLDQIQVIWPGQSVVAWVGKSISVALSVDSYEPNYEVGRLQALTEIIVSDSNDKSNEVIKKLEADQNTHTENGLPSSKSEEMISNSVGATIWHSLKNISFNLWKENNNQTNFTPTHASEMDNNKNVNKTIAQSMIYRVHPIACLGSDLLVCGDCYILSYPYNVFVYKKYLFSKKCMSIYKLTTMPFAATVIESTGANKKPNEKQEDKAEEKVNETPSVSSIYVNLCVIEDILDSVPIDIKNRSKNIFPYSKQPCIFLNDTLRNILHLEIGSRVTLQKCTSPPQKPISEMKVSPVGHWKIKSESLQNLVRNFVIRYTRKHKLIINSGSMIPFQKMSHLRYVSVTILQPKSDLGFFDLESVKQCKIEIAPSIDYVHLQNEKYMYKESPSGLYFRHVEKEIEEGILSLEMTLGLDESTDVFTLAKSSLSRSNILIIGRSGSGLSSLATHLSSKLECAPYFVHRVEVPCRHLKGKKVDMLLKILNRSLQECAFYQPSILVLHDIESLSSAPMQEHDGSQEHLYYTRVGEMLTEIIEEFQESYDIAVIATAPSASKLNGALIAPRGKHMFTTIITIPDLSKVDRLNILANIMKTTVSLGKSTLDLKDIAHKTEGFIVQDLVDFIDKSVFEAWKRSVADPDTRSPPVLEKQDMAKALENTKPLSLRGVDLFHNSGYSWKDVGGLQETKDMLIELLEWPVQYPELFSKAPLRLQSGVLLYGAPGTGKTLLAGAVAGECGLNFISIKGPELLSKYIGASEEAVRNIFIKAQSARPCVLFFDEFDSLAPKRGHDSTGVTDRVVNQLLTQLDGVEGLQGVWVMAATSRPDLLDPALLRPGRLDKSILCPLPTEVERLDILKALSRKMCLSEDVNLNTIAEGSENFTGADLQAVLYTAQLTAVEKSQEINNIQENNLETLSSVHPSTVSCAISVTQEYLLAALRDTQPSLSRKEKAKYALIYEKYEKSRNGIKDKNIPIEQKVTLA